MGLSSIPCIFFPSLALGHQTERLFGDSICSWLNQSFAGSQLSAEGASGDCRLHGAALLWSICCMLNDRSENSRASLLLEDLEKKFLYYLQINCPKTPREPPARIESKQTNNCPVSPFLQTPSLRTTFRTL